MRKVLGEFRRKFDYRVLGNYDRSILCWSYNFKQIEHAENRSGVLKTRDLATTSLSNYHFQVIEVEKGEGKIVG